MSRWFCQCKRRLPEPARAYGNRRRYEQTNVARVTFVKAAQRLGFSPDEMDCSGGWHPLQRRG